MHRFSIHQSTMRRWTFDRDVEFFAGAGVPAVGVSLAKLEDYGAARGLRLLRALELRVSSLSDANGFQLGDQTSEARMLERARRALDIASELGADSLVVHPGGATALSWEECAARARPLFDSLLRGAQAAHVRLAIEPERSLQADLSFLHSFDESLDFVAENRSPWLGVVLCLHQTWSERRVYSNIRFRHELIALVRVGDIKAGAETVGELVVPGDGDVPLRRMCRALGEAGFRGWYDIELSGSALDAEGYESAVRRAMAHFLELER